MTNAIPYIVFSVHTTWEHDNNAITLRWASYINGEWNHCDSVLMTWLRMIHDQLIKHDIPSTAYNLGHSPSCDKVSGGDKVAANLAQGHRIPPQQHRWGWYDFGWERSDANRVCVCARMHGCVHMHALYAHSNHDNSKYRVRCDCCFVILILFVQSYEVKIKATMERQKQLDNAIKVQH